MSAATQTHPAEGAGGDLLGTGIADPASTN
jgi:hypothetical protein